MGSVIVVIGPALPAGGRASGQCQQQVRPTYSKCVTDRPGTSRSIASAAPRNHPRSAEVAITPTEPADWLANGDRPASLGREPGAKGCAAQADARVRIRSQ